MTNGQLTLELGRSAASVMMTPIGRPFRYGCVRRVAVSAA